MRTHSVKTMARSIGGLALLFALPAIAAAQGVPRPAAEFSAGWVGFADDGVVSEGMIGGSVRWYVTPRLSIGPEVLYMSGQNHSHSVLTGNAVFDVLPPMNRRPRPVTPFVVAGAGMFQTRETFRSSSFTSTEGAFTAGGGVRARVGDHLTFGIDTRIGWELHLRVNGFLGVQF